MTFRYSDSDGAISKYLNTNIASWRLFDALWGAPEAISPDSVPAALAALSTSSGWSEGTHDEMSIRKPYHLDMARRR